MIESYHALLTPELAEASHEHLETVLRSRGLVFGGRPLCTVLRPRLMTADEYASLQARIVQDARTLVQALGYDMNSIEFAVRDGVPYAIDFMNPAPDADVHSVGEANFEWIVDAMAALAIRKALEPAGRTARYRWDTLLNPPDAAPRA